MVAIQSKRDVEKYAKYIDDPVGFCRSVLKFEPVPKQCQIMESLLLPPYATLAPSGNESGKTATNAAVVLWWHCTRSPSIIVTTAPKYDQLRDTLWKEIRKRAKLAGLQLAFLPKACRIERGPDDFAVGTTAKGETAFKGQHGCPLLFIVDEASAVDPAIFAAIETMFSPPGHAMLVTFNCDMQGTFVHGQLLRATKSERTGEDGAAHEWHVIRQSMEDHPNILAELMGLPPPVPHAMRLGKFETILKRHSQQVDGRNVATEEREGRYLATDILWPPLWATEYCERTRQKPRWWRPGPKAEIILLGRYPRQGSNAVWSEGSWYAASRDGYPQKPIPLLVPEIGCDVAAQGADDTSIHVRIGPCSVHHENYNGQREPETLRRLKQLADHFAKFFNEMIGRLLPAQQTQYTLITGRQIPIKIDNDGLGGTLSSFLEDQGYRVVRIGAGTKAIVEKDYPNRRSELWFTVAEMASSDEIDFSRIAMNEDGTRKPEGEAILEEMRHQAMSVTWSFDSRGRRVVMSKDDMKKEMGGSPDEMDSVNLAYAVDPMSSSAALPEVISTRTSPLASRLAAGPQVQS